MFTKRNLCYARISFTILVIHKVLVIFFVGEKLKLSILVEDLYIAFFLKKFLDDF